MTSTTKDALRSTALAALLFAATSAAAQPAATSTTAGTTTTSAPSATTSSAQGAIPDEFDSRSTRDELNGLLDRHPREVGVMLKLDPSLFRNEAWVAAYPALRDFVAAHPEVPQNASYFLERVHVPGDELPEPAAVRTTRQLIDGIQVFVVMLTLLGAASWLIRTLLEHRRWSRVSRVQTNLYNKLLYNKLLDRFTSHEDLMR